jgi:hypothetical protein
MEKLAALVNPERVVPATVEIVDIIKPIYNFKAH